VFEGGVVVEVRGYHLRTKPTPPSERLGREIPSGLERVIIACLAKDPVDRPQAAIDLEKQLTGCDVSGWDTEKVAAWWRKHEESIRARSKEAKSSAFEGTIAVDLASRRR
jgi:hypothetical protein